MSLATCAHSPKSDPFAKQLYLSFTKVFFLTTSMRQQGDSQQTFRAILNRIAMGASTEADWQILMQRVNGEHLSVEVRKQFDDALYIYLTKDLVRDCNLRHLNRHNRPVCFIKAIDNFPSNAMDDKDEEIENLVKVLLVSIGSKVMLRHNINVSTGLVNGSIGTVERIVFRTSESPPHNGPAILMVKFDNYSGPTIDGLVPIKRISRSVRGGNKIKKRVQFPLQLCYAITLHKSQGLTLPKAVLEMHFKELFVGGSYVLFSRVRKLEDLLLQTAYDLDRFVKIGQSETFKNLQKEIKRLETIANQL